MKHIVMLRFAQGKMDNQYYDLAVKTFQSLQETLPEIKKVSVKKNCVLRNGNYDLMIEMDIADKESLDTYLRHPLHIAFADAVTPVMDSRASFDYED